MANRGKNGHGGKEKTQSAQRTTNQKHSSLLKMLLDDEGHEEQTASDGNRGGLHAERRGFDCVLLEMKMPHLSGFEALKFIRQRHPETGRESS